MARWIFVSFVFVCVFCFIEAFPQSGSTQIILPTTMSTIETAVHDVVNSVQRGIQQIMEDPDINRLYEGGQRLLQNTASTIQTEAARIIPRTT